MLEQWVLSVMQRLGYWGLACLMFLDNVFPPIPSEIIMPTAGYTAALGHLSLWGVIVAGSCGSLAAAAVLYAVGRAIPQPQLMAWIDRYGHYIGLKTKAVEKALHSFERHGHYAVFFGRMVPAVRSLVSIPAGMSGMPFWKFMGFSAAGTIIWTSLLACLGYYFGQNKALLATVMHQLAYVIIAITVLVLLVMLYKRKTSN